MREKLDHAIETAIQVQNELRALPQRRKAMTDAELDQKLGDLAIVMGNQAETLRRFSVRLINNRRLIMSKKLWIQIFIIPNLRSLAEWLRMKDENDTGGDDEAAEAIEFALARLSKYINTGE